MRGNEENQKAIEILAKARYEECPHLGPWGQIGGAWQETYLEKAREDLTAILPLLCGGLEEERDQAVKRREHTEQWYAVRLERLRDLTRDRSKAAPEGSEMAQVWADIASILANGTLGPPDHPYEPPTYAQQLNIAKHRAEKAEQELDQVKGHVQDQRVEKVQAKQKLNQVREEVEKIERYAQGAGRAAGYPTVARMATKALAILDSSSSVSGDGKCETCNGEGDGRLGMFAEFIPWDDRHPKGSIRAVTCPDCKERGEEGGGSFTAAVEAAAVDPSSSGGSGRVAAAESETPGCTCAESRGLPNKDQHGPGCLYRRAIEVLEKEGPEGWEGHPPGHQPGPLSAAEVEQVRRVVSELQGSSGDVEERGEEEERADAFALSKYGEDFDAFDGAFLKDWAELLLAMEADGWRIVMNCERGEGHAREKDAEAPPAPPSPPVRTGRIAPRPRRLSEGTGQ